MFLNLTPSIAAFCNCNLLIYYYVKLPLTGVVLVDGDLPGVLPPPDHLRLGGAGCEALQGHVTALGLHHVRAAEAVHNLGRD